MVGNNQCMPDCWQVLLKSHTNTLISNKKYNKRPGRVYRYQVDSIHQLVMFSIEEKMLHIRNL